MADGALRSDVLRVLKDGGVEVSPLPESRYRLATNTVVIVKRLQDVVSRTTLAEFERSFGITKAKFFPANKVVPIDRAKASGNE